MNHRLHGVIVALGIAASMVGCAATDPVARPVALAYTHPAPINQVQDAAFWIHPTDPDKSLILLTNETRGLEVHDTKGYLLKLLTDASNPQYVDVIYGCDGQDLALVSCDQGVKAFAIDPEKRKLRDVTADAGFLKTFDDARPLGLFCYHSTRSGKFYFFVTDGAGHVQQHELSTKDGQIRSTLRRAFELPGRSKGGVADDDMATAYLAEDKSGVWQFNPEPDASANPQLVIKVNEHDLIPNVRGPALFRAAHGRGYLLVTSQGSKDGHTRVNVYDRAVPHRFVATINPSAERFGALDHSSGLDVTSAAFGALFPGGALAVNDQDTPSGSEDFKIYSWNEIASKARLAGGGNGLPRR